MKVRVAGSAGFCMGVRKAMDAVLEASRGNRVTYTLGPLIHNPQTLKMLESRHVYVAEDITGELAGKTVVIRAHGVTREMREKLKAIGAITVDATCPKVLRSERILRKYNAEGYDIVIVGDRGHAEIVALLSYTGGRGIVVETLEEARGLPKMDRVCIVAQTTFNHELFRAIADEVVSHAAESHVTDTVCASTDRRQDDVRRLAESTDATVVVGGKNSANTRRLAEISLELGQPTFHIEDPSDLDLAELSQYNEIGVTAGASTPNWVIKQVVDTIAGYTPEEHRTPLSMFMSLAYFAIDGNFLLSSGASALTVATMRILGLPLNWLTVLLPFFYLFPLHTLNRYLEINWEELAGSRHFSRLRRYWQIYLAAVLTCFTALMVIAWIMGISTFVIVVITYLLGFLYSVNIVPVSWNIRFRSLRDIPASKDLFTAAAWTFATVVLPVSMHGWFDPAATAVAAVFVFTLVMSRTTVLALGGIQSDKIIGLETIPVLIGKKKTLQLLYTANTISAAGLVIGAATRLYDPAVVILLAPVCYMLIAIKVISRWGGFFSLYQQVFLDAVFFIAAALALIV